MEKKSLSYYPDVPHLLTEGQIRKVLKESGLEFSDKGIRDIQGCAEIYRTRKYFVDELMNAPLRDQKVELLSLLDSLRGARRKMDSISPFLMTGTESQKSECQRGIARFEHEVTKRIEELSSGKHGAGRKRVHARAMLIQSLILIYKDETKEPFIDAATTSWGRERATYNPKARTFLEAILVIIEPGLSQDALRKDIERILKNPYKPTADLT